MPSENSMISQKEIDKYYYFSNADRINYYFSNDRKNNTKIQDNSIFMRSLHRLRARIKEENKDYEEKFANYKYHILLTGFSIQPLILAIMTLNIKNILFMYTKDTIQICNQIIRWIQLQKQGYFNIIGEDFLDEEPEQSTEGNDYLVSSSKPDAMYTNLRKIINDLFKLGVRKNEIAIDITGGKKSMVSGAFIAAAIEDIDMYYVDFGDYQKDNPVPGTEFLRLQKNPIKEFIDGLKEIFDPIATSAINKKKLKGSYKKIADVLIDLNILKAFEDEHGEIHIKATDNPPITHEQNPS